MRIRFHGRLANSLLVTVPLLLAPAVPLFAAPLSKSVLVPKTATGAKRATGAAVAPMLPLSALDAAVSAARQRNSRSVLAQDEALFKDAEPLTPNTPAPNYLRALAIKPAIVKPFAHLVKTAIYDGNVLPDIKMAMGLHIAQMHRSPYVMVHLRRLMQGRAQGKRLLAGLQNGISPTLAPQERLALRYAAQLTQSIHGVSDADFQEVRRYYNDSQIVELTTTVCFFNYFTRLCESLNLPIEEWALHPVPETKQHKANYHPVLARVGLISDDENTAFNNVAKSSLPHSPVATGGSATASTTPVSGPVATSASNATSPGSVSTKAGNERSAGLGIGIANSRRAMMRAPQMAVAWNSYWAAVRESSVIERPLLLHISFAVSTANGCRYCILHQVLGLRRVGVDMTKLVAMKKDDSALTAPEKLAVQFARKATRDARSVTDSDFEALKREFDAQGALDVLLQTCAFNYMNRFTDGLRLPSEDEAIRVYQEVYGAGQHS